MATAQDVRFALDEHGLSHHVVVVRTSRDGASAVAICTLAGAGAVRSALVSRGYSVAVVDSENPEFSSLRVH